MSGSNYFLWIAAALVLLASPLRAAIIEAEGVAAINPVGVERARQMAVQDAKNQVSMQAGVEIEMASIVTPRGVPLESSRIRPTATIGKVTILREWQTGDNFHVRISANVESSEQVLAGSLKYKKKIAATPFVIRKSFVTDDIDDIGKGFASELLRRLDNGNKFLTKRSAYVLPSNSYGPSQDGAAVMHLATMYDSQFLIAGEIVDAGESFEGGYFGVFQHKKRRFEIEVFLYDGLTGTLISRHRIEKFAVGDVAIGRDKPFSSASFLATNFGQAIGQAIDTAAEMISRDLESLPFTARVIRIADGRFYIDAGGTSLVAPGDKLVAYRLRREFPVAGFGSGTEYGITETPVATVSIVQVQPLFSICALPANAKGATIELGDLVRFDFINQAPDAGRPNLF